MEVTELTEPSNGTLTLSSAGKSDSDYTQHGANSREYLTNLDVNLGAVPLFSLPASMNICSWKVEKVWSLWQQSNIGKFLHSFHTNSKTRTSY